MENTHVGLVKIQDNIITKVKYMHSKFTRELGDTMTIDGVAMRVGVIGNSKNEVIDALNDFIKNQNAIIRKQNKAANIRLNLQILNLLK
tara:strand:- start:198 stop:464 length:267 start_codon:yes stop_codon:yes gene_type:complete